MKWVYLLMIIATAGLAVGSYLISGPFCVVAVSLAALMWTAPHIAIEHINVALDLHAGQMRMLLDRIEGQRNGDPYEQHRAAWDTIEGEVVQGQSVQAKAFYQK
jgi:hypothetical protein